MRIEGPFVQVPVSLLRGERRLDSFAKMVWIVLASRTNDEGLCWPFIKSIAADAGICERIVYRTIGLLKKNGWLEVTSRLGTSSVYHPIIPKVPRPLESGEVPMPLQNEVSVQPSSTTSAPHAEVCPQSSIHTDSTGGPLHDMQTTSARHADNLYPVSISKKINRGISGKGNEPKQEQGPDFAALFDCVEGRFVLGADARQKLEEDHPNVDLNATLKQIEARILGNKKTQPIKNVLAYLETCLSKPGGCVLKEGALVTVNGEVVRLKKQSSEELGQVEQDGKTDTTSPPTKAEEKVYAKWGDL